MINAPTRSQPRCGRPGRMFGLPNVPRPRSKRFVIVFVLFFHSRLVARRCANTSLGDVVSELLSALLNRLTELEQHEKELRVCQTFVDEVSR